MRILQRDARPPLPLRGHSYVDAGAADLRMPRPQGCAVRWPERYSYVHATTRQR